VNDSILDNLLQFFLRHTKGWRDFIESVHEVGPRDLNAVDVVICRD
jgi:hypothetical protein